MVSEDFASRETGEGKGSDKGVALWKSVSTWEDVSMFEGRGEDSERNKQLKV